MNTWYPVLVAVFGEDYELLGHAALQEEMHHQEWALRVESFMHLPVNLSFCV